MLITIKIFLFLAIILIFPFIFLTALILFGIIFFDKNKKEPVVKKNYFFTILIPAHDEESVIEDTILSLKALTYPKKDYQIVVIADNCSDNTATIAKKNKVKVVERFDESKKSKGYALEYAMDNLKILEKDVIHHSVVVIDADTLTDPKLLDKLAKEHANGSDWIQCYYTVRNPEDSNYSKMLTVAFALFNGSWQLGTHLIGLGASFRGNGMSFNVLGLKRHPFKVYGLTEDLEFSWTLRCRGEKVCFLKEARVFGEMVTKQDSAAKSQRIRWEQGRKELKSKFFRPILENKDLNIYEKSLYIVDLFMIPLTKFFGIIITINIIGIFLYSNSHISFFILIICFFYFLISVAYILTPFFKLNLPIAYLGSLLQLPKYVFWKLILLFKKDQKNWIRTKRNSERKVKLPNSKRKIT